LYRMCTVRDQLCLFFNVQPTTHIYTLSLHDALPISNADRRRRRWRVARFAHSQASRPRTRFPCRRRTGISYADGLLGYVQNAQLDRKSTRLNSSHGSISYAVFCLKKKKKSTLTITTT